MKHSTRTRKIPTMLPKYDLIEIEGETPAQLEVRRQLVAISNELASINQAIRSWLGYLSNPPLILG